MTPPPRCSKCFDQRSASLERFRMANAVDHFVWVCRRCRKRIDDKFVPHAEVVARLASAGLSIEAVPLFRDNSGEAARCALTGCLANGSELHHLMPQCLLDHPLIVPDADLWVDLTIYLCQPHHKIWHRVVTPTLAQEAEP